MQYSLVAAPGGSGLKEAVENQLVAELRNRRLRVAHEDVEDVLSRSPAASEALRGILPVEYVPTMRDITWNLTRDQVIALWRDALREALHRLETADADVRLLSCHFILYGGRRGEFYSPINVAGFTDDGRHQINRVLLLIDDLFDMYARLTEEGHLYDPAYRLDLHLQSVWEDLGRAGPHEFTPPERAFLELEWRVGVLATLLAWRHADMLVTESVARQLEANYTALGTKHLTTMAANMIAVPENIDVYLSHPISRPRREWRATGTWPEVVDQFNRLHEELATRGLNCIMPTAIDEFRLVRGSNGPMMGRLPRLDRRWPLSGAEEDLLYSPPPLGDGPEHEWILLTSDEARDREEPEISVLLRSLENLIMFEVPFRDHHLVANNSGLLVFRPMYDAGEVSSGVAAEIEHWGALASADPMRRAVFLHFEEDISAFAAASVGSDAARAAFDRDVTRAAVAEVERLGIATDRARRLVDLAQAGGDTSSLLDQGLGPETKDFVEKWPETLERAQLSVIRERLLGAPMPQEQVGIWIVPDDPTLQSVLDQVAQFLAGRGEAPQDWEPTVLRIMNAARG